MENILNLSQVEALPVMFKVIRKIRFQKIYDIKSTMRVSPPSEKGTDVGKNTS